MQVYMPAKEGVYPQNPTYNYHNLSATTGIIYHPAESFQLTANFGTAWRAPHVSELFSNGVHHGSASFEVGNATMVSEKAFNTIVGIQYNKVNKWQIEASAYLNYINNFIYLAPTNTTILTIRGAFPVFAYHQANALLSGLDWQVTYKVTPRIELTQKGSYLYAYNRSQHQYLVMMPPTRFETSLEYQFKNTSVISNSYIALSMQNVFEQKNVPANSDFVAPPAAYTLLNIQAATDLQIKKQTFTVGLSVNNLLNTAYRDYLDRFRYFANAIGTNVSLRLTVPIGHNNNQ